MAKRTIESLVRVQRDGAALGTHLPVNPGFEEPNAIDRARGVEPGVAEQMQAEHAIAARTLAELFPSQLRLWIFRQYRRRGDAPGLTRELMAMKPIPEGRDPGLYYKALLRSVERAGPEKKKGRKEQHPSGRMKAEYKERISLLVLREAQVTIGAYGHWRIYTEPPDEHYTWVYSDPSNPADGEAARAVIARGGDGFVEFVAEVFANQTRYPTELLKLHALGVEVTP